MSKLDKLRLFAEISIYLSETHQNWEYLDINELDKLDKKESNVYAAYWGEKLGLQTLISEIEWDLGISDSQIRQRRTMAKAKVRALENRRKREEFEAGERERIRNLPPIDQEKWARRQRTLKAYLEYRERAKRLKREPTY